MYCLNCGTFVKKDTDFCPECGEVVETGEDAQAPQKHGKPDDPFDCPVCGTPNKIKDTFKCPGCQHEHLCLEHRVKISGFNKETKTYVTDYYCKRCWKDYGFEMFED